MDDIFKMSIDELMHIEISTAGKKPEKFCDIPASTVIITKEDIEIYCYQTVEEILSNVPGMYMIDDYIWTGSRNFGVRGFFSTGAFDDMTVLVNGVDYKSDALYNSYPTEKISVPVEAIQRIEIIRGPMSVIYGSGAFFGAVNIITTSDYSENRLSMTLGSSDTKRFYAGLSGREGSLKYNFNAEYYSDAGPNAMISDLMSNDSVAYFPPDSGWNLAKNNIDGLINTQRVNINFNGTYNDFILNYGFTDSQKGIVESIVGVGEGSKTYYNSNIISLAYKKSCSEGCYFTPKNYIL